jgi:hypothetical protein
MPGDEGTVDQDTGILVVNLMTIDLLEDRPEHRFEFSDAVLKGECVLHFRDLDRLGHVEIVPQTKAADCTPLYRDRGSQRNYPKSLGNRR